MILDPQLLQQFKCISDAGNMAAAISNVPELPSYSASIFVLYEQIIIYGVFNDKLLLCLGWSASLSQTACQVLPVQHNWGGQL